MKDEFRLYFQQSGEQYLLRARHFNLFGIDTTPYPRPYAETLADKTFIHYPNPIKGNKPINKSFLGQLWDNRAF